MSYELLTVLLVIAVLGILGFSHVSMPRGCGGRSIHVKDINNLKNVGLAFRIFATDHQDRFPMMVSTISGGSREFVGDNARIFMHFGVMSNELSTPKILISPLADVSPRIEATRFVEGPDRTGAQVEFDRNQNISYFVGIDADETAPRSLLAGNRWITNSVRRSVSEAMHVRFGHDQTDRDSSAGTAGWALHPSHQKDTRGGAVVFGDGSVARLDSNELREALTASEAKENELALPD